MSRPVLASTNTAALQHNLKRVRQLAADAKVMSIVKADAYGHGLLTCCKALSETDAFGLLELDAAVSLRKAGFTQDICLLEGFFSADELPLIASNKLQAVIHSAWQIELLENFTTDSRLSVWLKIDTGMNRLGFSVSELDAVLLRLKALKCIDKVSIMSHLASADEPDDRKTADQLKQFMLSTENTRLHRSLANSAAILAHPDCQLDWVRPGIMLYGSSPFADLSAHELNLKPVMTLESKVISVKHCSKGETIGYGGSWLCPEDMSYAVVACGYADGYPRHAPSGTPVLLAGQRSQLIGRVSMDMITVDCRGISDVEPGSTVELWGETISVDRVAQMSGTISYELCCGITARVKRQVVSHG